MSESTLSERIQKLEDIEAIKKLTATYALCVNQGWAGKAVELQDGKSLFTDDIRWKNAAMNVDSQGREAVVKMLAGATAGLDLAMHSFTNPIIDVDGDTATGNWLIWVAIKANNQTNEVFQSEDLRYARTAAGLAHPGDRTAFRHDAEMTR